MPPKKNVKKGGKVGGGKVKTVGKAEPEEEEKKVSTKRTVDDEYRSATGVLISQPTARDVKIGNFTLSSYSNELIQDATIELTIGRRYGLIGSNGSGKSTFLKCLSRREVPIPDHIDIYLLEEESEPSEMTAVEATVSYLNGKVAELEAEAEKAMEEFGADADVVQDLYNRLDDLEPSTFEPRASLLLKGLGFNGEMFAKKTKDMSGGWRMRVALAQALLVKPTLLLLDEPTNHLDLEACVWLENYLSKKYDRCLIVISHSQDFLNSVCTNIIHITPKHKLTYYSGNYDTFVKTKAEQEANQIKQFRKEQDDIKHIREFIASCGTYSNLVRQAKSKQKIIDKMEERGLTEMPDVDPVFNFRWPDIVPLPPPVLAFYDVSFSYSGQPPYLYEHLDIAVLQDSRIALVGPNGVGKSTLLKLMASELSPALGQVRKHLDLIIGRYNQHSTEQLDPEASPLDFIRTSFPEVKKEEPEWRQWLGKYGITGKMQVTKIGALSDGQKSRLVFAMMAFKHPHLLLFDEPTNHLDMQCIDALADAIRNFNGGMVLVSHDFRLIDQVARDIWVCGDKTVTKWGGSIREYKALLARNMEF